jgi:hypothetical protein
LGDHAWRKASQRGEAGQLTEEAFSRRIVAHGASEVFKVAAKEGCADSVVNQNFRDRIFG